MSAARVIRRGKNLQRCNRHGNDGGISPGRRSSRSTALIRSFPRKRESRGRLLRILRPLPWVPAFAGTSGHKTPIPPDRNPLLENDARVAQVLVAVDEVDLPHLDFPARLRLHEAVTAPAGEEAGAVHSKFADQKI